MTLKRFKADFNLNSVDQVYFWKSEWEYFDPGGENCNVSAVYLTYRFVFMCYFLGSLIYNMTCSDLTLYFIFVTKWSLTIQLAYSMIYFFRLLWIRIKRRDIETERLLKRGYNYTDSVTTDGSYFSGELSNQSELPWPEKMIWILVNIVSVLPYGITIAYWVIIYDPVEMSVANTCDYVSNILVHGTNSPMALLDSIVMAIPIRSSHTIFPFSIALIYSIFSGFYEVGGGVYADGDEFIYPILNWKNSPGWAAVSCIVVLGLFLILHLVLCWGIYRLRVIFVNQYFTKDIGKRDRMNCLPKFESYQYQSRDKSNLVHANNKDQDWRDRK